MNDSKRLIIVFVLVMVILFAWQMLTPKTARRSTAPPPVSETTKTEVQTQPVQTAEQRQSAVSKLAAASETEAVLENDKFKIVLSSLGGTVKSVYLKKYKAELIPLQTRILETQVDADTQTIQNWLTIYEDDTIVVFQGPLKKTYRIGKDYTVSLKIELVGTANPNYQISFETGIALTETNKKDELKNFAAFYKNSEKINRLSTKTKPTTLADVQWIGLKSKYFTLILSSPMTKAIVNIMPLPDGRIGYVYKPQPNVTDYTLYFGPLDYNILKSYTVGWEAFNDLGWTRIFSVVILKILQFLFSVFRNYGVAIILFSLLMKAIFFPLSRISTKQMHQMQMLQPKIEELKKKYKGDPQALNRETMQLYRLYKINPFSGCLPLIFQLPVFWALYSVLQKTIELRGASFVFWLKDLSSKDPYYILPILMGISFLIQNFLTSADKKNMALLIFMPIFLTVIFLNFPSGLQLYWLLFNLLSIVESIISRGGIKWKTQKTITPLPTK